MNPTKIVNTLLRSLVILVIVYTVEAFGSTIWPSTTVPSLVDTGPDSAVELGVKFRSDTAGNITGIRFYKASTNTGTHVGNLWSSTGTRLATATFTGETASGWQQVNFSTPVTIAANTVYVASYFCPAGHYSDNLSFFATAGFDNAPLHALANGISGVNGVFAYGSSSSFPSNGWYSSNYWVDVVFTASAPPTLSSLTVTPAGQTISTGATQQFTATGTYSDSSTQNVTSQATWASSNTSVATINSAGLATAVNVGSTIISATLTGVTGSTNLTVQVTPLTITTSSLPGGATGAAYSQTLAASGGKMPYNWSIVSGSLPAGLTLNAGSGAISGTPTGSGTSSFTVQVSDANGTLASKALTITITTGNLSVTTAGLANGYLTTAYSQTLAAQGGLPPYSWSISSGKLPAGLTLNATTGTISGTPAATGARTFTVRVRDSAAKTATKSLTITVYTLPSITTTTLAAGTTGTAYSQTLTASGGKTPYSWSITGGSLPAGLTLNSSSGAITGTPASGGTGSFTVQVSDVNAKTATKALSITVNVTLPDTTPPTVSSVVPSSGATGTSVGANLTVVFSEAMDPSSISTGAFMLRDQSNNLITSTVTYIATSNIANLDPADSLSYSTTYTATIKGGASGVKDSAGNPMATDFSWSFTTGAAPSPGNTPILIISSTENPFSAYYAEILRTEGFNSFDVSDITAVTPALLNSHDVVILGDMTLTSSQVALLTDWVNAGGNLIAMRPDKKLAGLLGLTDKGTSLSNAYLLVDTSNGPGAGIVNQSIQFHGAADRYTLNGASKLATLYSNANTTTSDPAVTLKNAGANGGQAAAFTYDLARSVVYTRQGNPAWAGQARDGLSPIRPDDLFFGAASFDPQPDWVDLNKVAIPQADEQQRLLANMIIQMNLDKKPLPRFWYLPRNLPATIIMTGDDHGTLYSGGAAAARFNQFLAASPQGCSVDNWECVRSSSYVLPPIVASNPLTNSQAAAYIANGFEIGVHVDSSPGCSDWTYSALDSAYTSDLNSFASKYTSVPAPVTHRMHCVTWSDYDSQPKIELSHGIRLDTTYYFYPGSWFNNTPGLFTGSGMPMRFADINGTTLDIYQAVTQMTDESDQTYPFTIDTLLDRAIGPEGYYGVFTVNAHTDVATSSVSDAVVNSALARDIPIVSAKQMLTWLDGRNGSSFNSIAWNGTSLGFSVNAGQGTNGLTAMVPVPAGRTVSGITRDGSSISFTTSMIKGLQYARFPASTGVYQVSYAGDVTPPAITGVTPAAGATGVGIFIRPAATFSKALDPATVTTATFELRDPANNLVPATVTYDAASRTATLVPAAALAYSKTYSATIKGGASGVRDLTGNPLASDSSWSFTTFAASSAVYTIWPSTAVPGIVDGGPDSAVELGVKFRSDVNGYVTGIRFYKASANSGTHAGNLWSATGTLLATATFTNETTSGWQQVNFSTPVAITANTVYVASYHTNVGHDSDDLNYFTGKGVDNPPLHALAAGVSGINGVYAYGSSSIFPTQDWHSSNYWVDVLFQP